MGSARRIAEDLMRNFLLTEEEAYSKVRYIEKLQAIGDFISDALYPLLEDGDLEETLGDLIALQQQLAYDTLNLSAAFTGVERRRKTHDESENKT